MRFVILQDHKENRQKCTLTPLEGREDVRFVRLARPAKGKDPEPVQVEGGILLRVSAPPLCFADRTLAAKVPVVLVDSTWARVDRVLRRVQLNDGCRFVYRSLPRDIVTAYPRVSKVHEDPREGLASVEALYAASVILGQRRADLLAGYRWQHEFLQRNRLVFARFDGGVGPRGAAGAE